MVMVYMLKNNNDKKGVKQLFKLADSTFPIVLYKAMKALLFDLDGTLVDTLEDIRAAINHALRLSYNREITSPECRQVVGRGLKNALKGALWFSHAAYPEEEVDILLSELRNYYFKHAAVYSKPYEGMKELLEEASSKGYKLGVLSNKSDDLVKLIVKDLFPSLAFCFVHGQREGYPLKPAKEALDAFLQETSLKKEEVVYIGDSEVDAEFIRNSGLKGCIVTYGFRSREELSKITDIEKADSVKELKERIL